MTRAVLDGAAGADANLVFADNLYVYGPSEGPMTEEKPQLAQGPKGRSRIEMVAAILGAHAEGRLRCTIGRSSDCYGPGGTGTTAADNIMKPTLWGQASALARFARPTPYAQLPRGHGACARDTGRTGRSR
jgi:nucleoside-diphosphate-sugar epimerase